MATAKAGCASNLSHPESLRNSSGLLRHSKPACRAMTAIGEMDDDRRDLIRGLFAAATAHLETAHETTTDGQSAKLSSSEYQACADKLRSISAEIEALANSVTVLARTAGSSSA